ncbi:MAG: hypothetical protein L0Y58_01755 [Verrucomicrobia subdivision 3 bacterium]|nr:hypothetical protein [Limisphaerales bacterium]
MKNSLLTKWSCGALLAFNMVAGAQDKPAIHTMSSEDEVLISATATVQALDLEKRELTLKGPLGDTVTVTVDKAVKRLDEIKAGDEVTAKYYVSIAAELREPTAAEKEKPLMITEGVAKAPKGTSPAAGGLRMIRVVATVEGLERPTRLVTLKGPRGNYLSVRARDVKRLEKLHLGDTIVVTFTEALAVSVEKAKKQND